METYNSAFVTHDERSISDNIRIAYIACKITSEDHTSPPTSAPELERERAALDRRLQALRTQLRASHEREAQREAQCKAERMQRVAAEAREAALRRQLAARTDAVVDESNGQYFARRELKAALTVAQEQRDEAFASRAQAGGAKAEADGLRRVASVIAWCRRASPSRSRSRSPRCKR